MTQPGIEPRSPGPLVNTSTVYFKKEYQSMEKSKFYATILVTWQQCT